MPGFYLFYICRHRRHKHYRDSRTAPSLMMDVRTIAANAHASMTFVATLLAVLATFLQQIFPSSVHFLLEGFDKLLISRFEKVLKPSLPF